MTYILYGASLEHEHLVGKAGEELDIVRHDHDSAAIISTCMKTRRDIRRVLGVKRSGRFVSKENPRAFNHSSSNRHTLTFTSGKLTGKCMCSFDKANTLERKLRAIKRFVRRHALNSEWHGNITYCIKVFDEIVILKDECRKIAAIVVKLGRTRMMQLHTG